MMIDVADPRPGDWAQHRTKELDERQVTRVDPAAGHVWLNLAGTEVGPFPLGNYRYAREHDGPPCVCGSRMQLINRSCDGVAQYSCPLGHVLETGAPA
jgi:hypothetical protein